MPPCPSQAGINLDTAAVEKAIVFIFYPVKYEDGRQDIAAGTGFLVGVPQKGDPSPAEDFDNPDHRAECRRCRQIWRSV